MKTSILIVLALFLSGCADLIGPNAQAPGTDAVHPIARPGSGATAPPDDARTVEDFDTTSQAERTAALASAGAQSDAKLGVTIASLGDATKPGFWLETPLVDQSTKGRLEYGPTGKSVNVDLIAIDGPASGGSRISLAALRLLGAPLGGLAELAVYGAP